MFGRENEFLTIEQHEGTSPYSSVLVRCNADRVRRNAFGIRFPMLLIERVHWERSDHRPCMGTQAKASGRWPTHPGIGSCARRGTLWVGGIIAMSGSSRGM
jgi:hypothetical protein